MSPEQRESMLSSLATRTGCTVCHQEAYSNKHHGAHALDMHHAPVLGRIPLSCAYGRTVSWWHHQDATSYFADFIYPDERRELVRVLPDGTREDWTGRREEAKRLACGRTPSSGGAR